MKPTKMRNKQIYYATSKTRSAQTSCSLSNDLRKKFGKRSARIIKGDTVKVLRGEFYGTVGKVKDVITRKNSITIDGIKKEKVKGDKIDIPIHTTNVIITTLNDDDKWRINKMHGKTKSSLKKIKEEEAKKSDEKTNKNKTEQITKKSKKDEVKNNG